MVADDQPFHLAPVEAILISAGYDVVTAANGREVLDKAASFAPDLFLLDVDMPELDGFETCCCLKDDPVFQDIPIIFMSAEDGITAIDCAFELGGNDFLAKPFNRAEMLVRVRAHLRAYFERKQYRERVLADARALSQAIQGGVEVGRGGMDDDPSNLGGQGLAVEFRFRDSTSESRTSDVLSLLGGTYLRAKRKGISLTMPGRPDDFTLAIAPSDLKHLLDCFSDHFLGLLTGGCGCHVKLSRRDPRGVCIQFRADLMSYDEEKWIGQGDEVVGQIYLPEDLANLARRLGAWAELSRRVGNLVQGELVLPAQI